MSKANGLIGLDFETFYDKAEYSLSCMPTHMYLNDPRFDAYMVSVYDGDTVKYCGNPAGFDWNLLSGMTVCAHNASFDEQVYLRLLALGRIPRPETLQGGAPKEWICTADMVSYLGVKRDLKSAARTLLGKTLDKSVREKMSGKSALELAQDPETIDYAMEDAVSCYELADKYLAQWPAIERQISKLNREAGYRGMALNYPLVVQGVLKLEACLQRELDLIPWVKDGLTPLSRTAAKLEAAKVGIPLPLSLAKDSQDFINWAEEYGVRYPWVKAMGTYRSVNTLLSRVHNLKDGYVPATGRYPYAIKYFGAATGRFSGGSSGDSGGKFNMQNMPRDIMHGVDVRPMFTAAPGNVLIVADYSQIEARVLLWRVGDEPKLELIRKGLSVYQAYGEALGLCAPGSDAREDDPDLYKYCKACVAGETLVLTDSGYKPIVRVMPTDMVWDGSAFVAHEGVVCNGYRNEAELVRVNGERYTWDHKIYTSETTSVQAGDLSEGEQVDALSWRNSSSGCSCWHDVWALAVGIHRALSQEWGLLCAGYLHALREGGHRYVGQFSAWVLDPLLPLRNRGRKPDKVQALVGTGSGQVGPCHPGPLVCHEAEV